MSHGTTPNIGLNQHQKTGHSSRQPVSNFVGARFRFTLSSKVSTLSECKTHRKEAGKGCDGTISVTDCKGMYSDNALVTRNAVLQNRHNAMACSHRSITNYLPLSSATFSTSHPIPPSTVSSSPKPSKTPPSPPPPIQPS